jgi:hypothetical protein
VWDLMGSGRESTAAWRRYRRLFGEEMSSEPGPRAEVEDRGREGDWLVSTNRIESILIGEESERVHIGWRGRCRDERDARQGDRPFKFQRS